MNSPIFIHSLFRTSSTYLFKVFRRSDRGYWCYQEPVHEAAFFAKDNPVQLLQYTSETIQKQLHHPYLGQPYFFELHEVHPFWKDLINKRLIYDGYFDQQSGQLTDYLAALIHHAKGRPVIQECRTSQRIAPIKQSLGGVHVYLWRNPWDQWWSYKSTDYFDTANQLILQGSPAPEVISRLKSEIGFTEFRRENLSEEFSHFETVRLSGENSYMLFYTLWCLGLLEGQKHADVMLNIDALSDRPVYRQETLDALGQYQVEGLSFDDCQVAQAYYTESDRKFFEEIEDRVHGLLLLSRFSQKSLDAIVQARAEFQPTCWQTPFRGTEKSLIETTAKVRDYFVRVESREAIHVKQLNNEIQAALARAEQAEEQARQVEAQKQEALARAEQAEEQARQVETQKQEALARAEQAEEQARQVEAQKQEALARAEQAEEQARQVEAQKQEALARAGQAEGRLGSLSVELQGVYASESWRMTYPLRLAGKLARWFVRGSIAWLTFSPTSRPRRVLRQALVNLKHAINARPALKARLMAVLGIFPPLRERLRRVGNFHSQAPAFSPPSQPQELSLPQMPAEPDLTSLTPGARRIYARLKDAIERSKKEIS